MDAAVTSLDVVNAGNLHFVLPDCLFDFSNLVSINAAMVILLGDSVHHDPFARLATAMNQSSVGTISFTSAVFQPFGSTSTIGYIPYWPQIFADFSNLETLVLSDCGLGGELPQTVPTSLTTFSLTNNFLIGSIPSTIFHSYASTSSAAPSFSWMFSDNFLDGSLPATLFTALPVSSSITLFLDNNLISGTIPKSLLSFTYVSTATNIALYLNGNSIDDTLPNDLWGLPFTMSALESLTIVLQNNMVSGTIPTTWMSSYSFPVMTGMEFSMQSCNISGSLHSGVLPASAPGLRQYNLFWDNNPLNAPIAQNLIPAILSNTFIASRLMVSISCGHCGITGDLTLPSPPTNSPNPLPAIMLTFNSNSLTTFVAEVGTPKYLYHLDLRSNPLQGSIDNLFSSSSSVMTVLTVGNTQLSGAMPFMASMNTENLQALMMDDTNVDFCSGGENRTFWSSPGLSSCSLLRTSAFTCSSSYPGICKVSAPISPMAPSGELPPAPTTPVASETPQASSGPSTPSTSPPGATSPTSTPTAPGCPGTRPSAEFQCVNGVWTSSTTVTTPTLVISPGTSEVIVNGNVTSGTVVLQGIGSSITVTGCFTNLSVVTIQLTPEDLKKLGSHSVIELLRSDGNCSDYSTVAVGTTVSGSSCRTVKVDKATTSSGSLSGVFSVSSSGCNLWWIILVSVLAVLVIGGMIALLIILHVRKQNSISKAKATLHAYG